VTNSRTDGRLPISRIDICIYICNSHYCANCSVYFLICKINYCFREFENGIF
jgi:hypothetical protein